MDGFNFKVILNHSDKDIMSKKFHIPYEVK